MKKFLARKSNGGSQSFSEKEVRRMFRGGEPEDQHFPLIRTAVCVVSGSLLGGLLGLRIPSVTETGLVLFSGEWAGLCLLLGAGAGALVAFVLSRVRRHRTSV